MFYSPLHGCSVYDNRANCPHFNVRKMINIRYIIHCIWYITSIYIFLNKHNLIQIVVIHIHMYVCKEKKVIFKEIQYLPDHELHMDICIVYVRDLEL